MIMVIWRILSTVEDFGVVASLSEKSGLYSWRISLFVQKALKNENFIGSQGYRSQIYMNTKQTESFHFVAGVKKHRKACSLAKSSDNSYFFY